MIVLLLHYSTVLSELHDRNVVLAQRVALLEQRVQELAGQSPRAAADERELTEPREPAR